ncbi:MAG: phosphatidylserine decarboxylase family protein [Candidatus Dependentiae bacterium]
MLWELLSTNLLWTQGLTLLLFIIAGWILSFLIYRPLSYLLLFFFLFCVWFFRNPQRACPELQSDKSVIVSPADGKIVDITFGDVGNGFAQKVSIFLSVFDAHVNWIPFDGTVSHTAYHEGSFTLAFLPKSSTLNERNDVFIKTNNGKRLMVRQIAGTIARRICCWVHAGDMVKACDTFGMIRFGSRVELFLPEDVSLEVGIGQMIVGGQTVIGRWQSSW